MAAQDTTNYTSFRCLNHGGIVASCHHIYSKHLAGAGSCHLRDVRSSEATEAELEAVRLGEVVLHSQANCLAGRGDQPVSLKHFPPPVRHGGYVFCFDHILEAMFKKKKNAKEN